MENHFESPDVVSTSTVFAMGASTPIREVERALGRLAAADVNVLLHGETGTGKRVLAEAMHAASSRAASPFLALATKAGSESHIERELFGDDNDGLLAQAPGATLYLEEIAALPLQLQRRLVRALDTPDVRGAVRIIATTTIELEEPLRLGRFLPELYFDLALVRLSIPPLRERREDIAALAGHFICGWCERMGVRGAALSCAALTELRDYAWPGNVDELAQTLGAALRLTRGAEITAECIRSVLGRRPRRHAHLDVFPLRTLEREYIATALARCGWNQSLAARRLGIGRNTLMRKIRSFKLGRSEAA